MISSAAPSNDGFCVGSRRALRQIRNGAVMMTMERKVVYQNGTSLFHGSRVFDMCTADVNANTATRTSTESQRSTPSAGKMSSGLVLTSVASIQSLVSAVESFVSRRDAK